MGTPHFPDSKPDAAAPAVIEDNPRIGSVTWIMLAAFLIPPAAIVYLENQGFQIPHPALWEILLGAPIFVILISFPRCYRLSEQWLVIAGFFYRLRIPREDILSIDRASFADALTKPGSVFCTNPRRAWLLKRRRGIDLVISPANPDPFIESLGNPRPSGAGGEK